MPAGHCPSLDAPSAAPRMCVVRSMPAAQLPRVDAHLALSSVLQLRLQPCQLVSAAACGGLLCCQLGQQGCLLLPQRLELVVAGIQLVPVGE